MEVVPVFCNCSLSRLFVISCLSGFVCLLSLFVCLLFCLFVIFVCYLCLLSLFVCYLLRKSVEVVAGGGQP